ncbi:MAG: proline dehydrogenase family protein [Bacteroidales bacterium]|nr:proline dehydrogenase family protein [Bacteroidales bacterium]
MISFEDTEVAFRYKTNAGMKRAYLLFKMISNPSLVKIGKRLTYFSLRNNLPISWAIKPTLYRHFVGGESLQECDDTVNLLAIYKVKTILDYSVEGGKDPVTMQRTLEETLRSVDNASRNPNIPFAVFKPTAFASSDVLTLASEGKNLDEKNREAVNRFYDCVEKLCRRAWELEVPIMIDAEDSWYQPYVDDVVTLMMEKYNKKKAVVYNTLQMYRTDRVEFLEESIRKARKGEYFLGIKFVRGAYMEKERKRAEENGYPSPIQPDKAATDAAYDKALEISMANLDQMCIFNGTHNERSNILLTELISKYNLQKNDSRIWFSQLYGMSDHISFNLANQGYNVAKYVPYGPVFNILPYLLRRAEENTSIAGQTGRELTLISREMNRRRK